MSVKKKNFKDFCKECSKRGTCVELCPPAAAYVNQDHVSQKEILVEDVDKINHLDMKDVIPTGVELDTAAWIFLNRYTKLTKKQKKCLYLRYWKRKSGAEIARDFDTSRQNVNQILNHVKYQILRGGNKR